MLVWPNRYQSAGLPVDGRWKLVEELQQIARAVARDRDATLVDGVEVTRGHDEYFFDSVHLNPVGYAAIARAVADVLESRPPIGASP